MKRLEDDLIAAYRGMAADHARESDAHYWAEGLIEDAAPDP
ncbi:hypothetical protein [Reyranella sp.]